MVNGLLQTAGVSLLPLSPVPAVTLTPGPLFFLTEPNPDHSNAVLAPARDPIRAIGLESTTERQTAPRPSRAAATAARETRLASTRRVQVVRLRARAVGRRLFRFEPTRGALRFEPLPSLFRIINELTVSKYVSMSARTEPLPLALDAPLDPLAPLPLPPPPTRHPPRDRNPRPRVVPHPPPPPARRTRTRPPEPTPIPRCAPRLHRLWCGTFNAVRVVQTSRRWRKYVLLGRDDHRTGLPPRLGADNPDCLLDYLGRVRVIIERERTPTLEDLDRSSYCGRRWRRGVHALDVGWRTRSSRRRRVNLDGTFASLSLSVHMHN